MPYNYTCIDNIIVSRGYYHVIIALIIALCTWIIWKRKSHLRVTKYLILLAVFCLFDTKSETDRYKDISSQH